MKVTLDISVEELSALASAAWRPSRQQDLLVDLLRKIDPSNGTLQLLDRKAREIGLWSAGSPVTEQLHTIGCRGAFPELCVNPCVCSCHCEGG